MTGWRRSLGALAAGLAATGSLAACGSSSSSSTAARTTSTTQTGSRAQWVTAADAICRAGRAQALPLVAKIKQAAQSANTASARQQDAQTLDQLIGLASGELAKQRALPVPAEIRTEIERWFATEGASLAVGRRLAAALRANDVAAVQRLSLELQRVGATSDRLARRLGLRVCVGPTG